MVVDSSRPIAHVAREIGVNETTLGYWVKDYREKHAGDEPPLDMPERARLRELERENRELKMKCEFLSKAVLRSGASVTDRYEFIDVEYATGTAADTAAAPTITQMCTWLKVSRSGFYDWGSRPESATAKRRKELKLLITKAFGDSDGTSGYRRVAAQLARWGVRAGRELVGQLMGQQRRLL